MTGGLLNIVSYGCNDLYLTGAPQITFFKTAYRRYTNFAVESLEVAPNTNTNFGEEFEVIISRYGDLLSKTYLKVDIPEVYFSYDEFQFTKPPINFNIPSKVNYNVVVEFMKYNTAAYRTINRDAQVEGISTFDISNNLNILINGPGQIARNNFHNLYQNDVSETVDGVDIRYLLNTSDIYNATETLLSVDTSNNTVINQLLKLSESCIDSSILCQKYYFIAYRDDLLSIQSKVANNNLNFKWNNKLGHNMIEYIDVYIGGEFIDRTEGEYLELNSQLTLKYHLEDAYNKMIGNVSNLTTFDNKPKPAYTLLIPLQFWFTKNYGSAYPLIASEHNDVIIKIKFRNINLCGVIETIQNYSYALDDLWNDKKYNLNCSLFVDYIFLDYLERKKFAQSAHEYLIETVQTAYEYVYNNKYSYSIDFKHPCKELLFFFQKLVYITDTNGQNKKYFDIFTPDISGNNNSIRFASLSLNGDEKVKSYIGSATFYNNIQPWETHRKTPNPGIYTYSFALVPEELQPSGTLNFSRVKDVLLNFNIDPEMFYYYLNDIKQNSAENLKNTTELVFKIYGVCYNILRIKNGYCGLAFSAF